MRAGAGAAGLLWLALLVSTIAFVVPLTESGVCITLLLTRLPYGGGWLYAATLPAPRSDASASSSSCW